MYKRAVLAVVLGVLVGCGGSDKWLDVPMMQCSELEDKSVDVEDLMRTMVGPGTCRQAGALNYGGKYRCEDEKVQVLCEEA